LQSNLFNNRVTKLAIAPFTKLSASYFFYFAVVGLIVPYLGFFLDDKQFNSREIGEILAIVTATKVIGPMLWALVADRTGQQLSIIRLGALLACLCFIALAWLNSYWLITLFLSLSTLFWAAILPQMEVMTQNSIRRSAKIYARIRLWGSIGFIVLAVVSGKIIALYSSQAFVYLGCLVLLLLWLSTLILKQPRIKSSAISKQSSLLSKLFTARFLLFFLAGMFLQISFAPYYGFFALYLRDLSYPSYAVGLLSALAVVAEIFIFINAGRIFKLCDVKSVLAFSLLLTALRWLLVAKFGDNTIILIISQLFHAASFGLFHSASILFLQQHFDVNQQSRAQAIYIGGVYGIGGAIGAFATGILWLNGQGAEFTFEIAAFTVFIGTCFALLMPKITQCYKDSI
jgi:MFS transporter, PPP family, 3-phenylpropionic acid transporter